MKTVKNRGRQKNNLKIYKTKIKKVRVKKFNP